MKLFLIAYANVAILVPGLWIGARLWLRRHYQTPAPGLVSAQIIAFPIAIVASKRRHAPPHLETNGQLLTQVQRSGLLRRDLGRGGLTFNQGVDGSIPSGLTTSLEAWRFA